MKRMRVIGLCLVATVAMSAVAVSSAFATAPEFGRCVAKAGGKFQDAGCTKPSIPGKEKFEWEPGIIKKKFTSKLKEGTPTLETAGGTKITCNAEQGGGEITGEKSVGNVTAKFNGCKTSGLACENGAAEEINTNKLQGVIGVEKLGETAVKNKLAESLAPESPATTDAEFECAGLRVIVRGTVLHTITANKMLLVSTEKFVATKGEQKPDHFAGGKNDELILESSTAGAPFEEAGQAIIASVTFEEKGEASTVN
jgi:hypothetical protein